MTDLLEIVGEVSGPITLSLRAEIPALADRLASMSLGQVLLVRAGSGEVASGLYGRIYFAARRRGFAVNIRRSGADLYIRRGEGEAHPPRNGWHASAMRNAEIVARYEGGETMRQIAALYGVTHQRVEQIISCRGVKTSARIAALDRLAEPYLAALSDQRKCVLCRDPVGATQKRDLGMCHKCARRLRALQLVSNMLRGYRRTGQRHALHQAMWHIRRDGIPPEAMEIV